jgi:hypothetical protein
MNKTRLIILLSGIVLAVVSAMLCLEWVLVLPSLEMIAAVIFLIGIKGMFIQYIGLVS